MQSIIRFLKNVWNAQRNADALFDAGMDSEAITNIRELLKFHDVPTAAFVDDHVKNAIWQRNEARKEAEALRQQVSKRDSSGRFAPKNTGQ